MMPIDYRQLGEYIASDSVPMGATTLLMADAFNDQDTISRKAVNIAGNAAGGIGGRYLANLAGGNPYLKGAATVAGMLGGGYISDRVGDMFDPAQGLTPDAYLNKLRDGTDFSHSRISPTELLNTHLENDPIAQQAMYQEKIRQARLMQREQQRQQMLNYQAQMAQQQGA